MSLCKIILHIGMQRASIFWWVWNPVRTTVAASWERNL